MTSENNRLLDAEQRYQDLVQQHKAELDRQQWTKNQSHNVVKEVQGATKIEALTEGTLKLMVPIMQGCCGVFYLLEQWSENEDSFLRQTASYAAPQKDISFEMGEGFVGQCALDKATLHIENLPEGYLTIKSGSGTSSASALLLIPVLHEDKLKGVIELASFDSFTPEHIDFLEDISSVIAGKIHNIESRNMVNELLLKSYKHTEEVKKSNDELLLVKEKLEQKNNQVQEASRYKSEFLANMSHELRTPLNSLLLLSKKLAKNVNQNLNAKEAEYASVISNSGEDLLTLINDILDLSKIEAGKMTLNATPTSLSSIPASMERLFTELARKKKLDFKLNTNMQDITEVIQTDSLRVEQILRNFLSNAFKFTSKGSVSLSIKALKDTSILKNTGLQKSGAIAFEVKDTGIGIEKEKLGLVFESFQQADGSTSRQFGGTGLGLSISRELAKLLGAEIHIESTFEKGSTFTLYIPNISGENLGEPQDTTLSIISGAIKKKKETFVLKEPLFCDDRDKIKATTPFVLISEDNPALTKLLIEQVHIHGQLALATQYPQEVLKLAEDYTPAGIILDLGIANMAGKALQIKLSSSKKTSKTPLLTFNNPNDALTLLGESLVNALPLPLQKDDLKSALKGFYRLESKILKKAYIIGEDQEFSTLLKENDLEVHCFATYDDALAKITDPNSGILVVNKDSLGLEGLNTLEALKQPTLILSNNKLTSPELGHIRHFTNALICDSVEGIDILGTSVHKFMSKTTKSENKTKAPPELTSILANKNVLIVDDDMRNIFALSALLEDLGINILEATSGDSALDVLGENARVDMVLMDIMMPGLDGHAVMERIRNNKSNKYLPVIAMSAKAMREDRTKALDAGADEFVSKPIEIEQLTSIMELWFKKKQYAS